MSPDVVDLLRDVPLPDDPAGRYAGVVARRRRSDRRRYAVLSASLATVLVVAGISAFTLRAAPTKDVASVLSAMPTTAHVVGTGAFPAGSAAGVVSQFRITGDIDFTHHATEFEVSLPSSGSVSPVPQRVRQIGKDRWTLVKEVGGQGDVWVHDDVASTNDFDQLDPQTLFSHLRDQQSSLRDLGTADVDGVRTTHYAVPRQKEAVGSPFAEGGGEVYVDAQGQVRRLSLTQADGSFTFTFSRFGEPVDISPPPAGQVKEASDLRPKGESCTTTPSSTGSSAYSSSCTITSGGVQVQPSLSPEAKALMCASFAKTLADHPESASLLAKARSDLGCPVK